MSVILPGWVAAVVLVFVLVTRPWKSTAARAPLPVALATAMAVWVLSAGFATYNGLMAKESSTAATITIAIVPIKALLFALLAYVLGRTFLTARTMQGPKLQRWGMPAALAALCLYLVGADVRAQYETKLELHAASTALSADEVNALTARIRSGDALADEQGAFLGNPLCPPAVLAEFAASPELRWRRAVARNDKLEPALAEKLSQDPDEDVRYMLAFNRQLPAPLLSRLAADSNERVREVVVWTDSLPDEVFNRLVDDPSPRVRATVAIQARTSPEAMAKLRADPVEQVRQAAQRRPDR